MKKIYFLAFLALLCYGNVKAQPAEMMDPSPVVSSGDFSKKLFIGTGLAMGSFQNANYSDTRFSDTGGNLHIGFSKRKGKKLWETAVVINVTQGTPKEYEHGGSQVKNYKLYYKHLRKLSNGLYVGGTIDLFDFYSRTTEILGNNSNIVNTGSHLYGSLVHDKKISENWNLESSFDLGLLSFVRSSTSFAFSAPQNILEDGDFGYQDDLINSFFGLSHYELKSTFKHINISTSFLFNYKKRITLGYQWNVKRVARVKSYPMTTGLHNIVVRFNIINKTEKKIKKNKS